MNPYEYATELGQTCYIRGDRKPDPVTGIIWKRHERVYCNGQRLEGSVMTTARRNPVGEIVSERSTCFRNELVQGEDYDWLRRRNGVSVAVQVPRKLAPA